MFPPLRGACPRDFGPLRPRGQAPRNTSRSWYSERGMQADLLPAIGGHRVERELGAGGMGKVYLCRDEALDRPVAIKVLLPDMLEQTEMRARFLREARALARVSSPNCVLVHAVGEDAVVGPFVVMEYL